MDLSGDEGRPNHLLRLSVRAEFLGGFATLPYYFPFRKKEGELLLATSWVGDSGVISFLQCMHIFLQRAPLITMQLSLLIKPI